MNGLQKDGLLLLVNPKVRCQLKKNKKDELISEIKNSEIYKKVMEKFPDAELIDVKLNERKEDKND